MTTTGTTPPPTPVPGEVKPQKAAPRRRAAGAPGTGQGAASPIVKIVLLVICALWLIPTIGIIVTSFRTPEAANTSGWWTVITSPLDFTQYTTSNYTQAWNEGMGNAFINSFAVVCRPPSSRS